MSPLRMHVSDVVTSEHTGSVTDTEANAMNGTAPDLYPGSAITDTADKMMLTAMTTDGARGETTGMKRMQYFSRHDRPQLSTLGPVISLQARQPCWPLQAQRPLGVGTFKQKLERCFRELQTTLDG